MEQNQLNPEPIPVIDSQPIHTQPAVNIEPPIIQPQPKKSKLKSMILLVLGVTVVMAIGIILTLTYLSLNLERDLLRLKGGTSLVSDEALETAQSDPETQTETDSAYAYMAAGNFRVEAPQDWSLVVSVNMTTAFAGRLYPPNHQNQSNYIEIHSSSVDQAGSNPLLQITTETQENGYIMRRGKETLMDSQRVFVQAEIANNSTVLTATLIGDAGFVANNEAVLEKLIAPAKSLSSLAPSGFKLIPQAFAQMASPMLYPSPGLDSSPSSVPTPHPFTNITPQTTQTKPEGFEIVAEATHSGQVGSTIAGFDKQEFNTISVMQGPYPERLTRDDRPYKDGYARLYKFYAYKGQRIETLAEEDPSVGSFLRSELYDQDGRLINSADTRLDNRTHVGWYTGFYYLIVRSFDYKEGPLLLKVFDKNQTENLFYAKYADGSEYLLNTLESEFTKPQQAAAIIAFSSPIEIIDGNKVRYFRNPGNDCINCSYISDHGWYGDVTIPVSIFDHSLNAPIPIKLTKISINQVLVQPYSTEAFEKNKTFSVSVNYGTSKVDPTMSSGASFRFSTN